MLGRRSMSGVSLPARCFLVPVRSSLNPRNVLMSPHLLLCLLTESNVSPASGLHPAWVRWPHSTFLLLRDLITLMDLQFHKAGCDPSNLVLYEVCCEPPQTLGFIHENNNTVLTFLYFTFLWFPDDGTCILDAFHRGLKSTNTHSIFIKKEDKRGSSEKQDIIKNYYRA